MKRARYAAELEGDKPYVSGGEAAPGCPRRAPGRRRRDSQKLRRLAERMPDTALAAGRLIDREQERARQSRDEWRAWRGSGWRRRRIRACGGVIERDGRVVACTGRSTTTGRSRRGRRIRARATRTARCARSTRRPGCAVQLGEELATTTHVDAKGRPKRVRWWRMTPLTGEFTPTDEVDEPALGDAGRGARAARPTRATSSCVDSIRARQRRGGRRVVARRPP